MWAPLLLLYFTTFFKRNEYKGCYFLFPFFFSCSENKIAMWFSDPYPKAVLLCAEWLLHREHLCAAQRTAAGRKVVRHAKLTLFVQQECSPVPSMCYLWEWRNVGYGWCLQSGCSAPAWLSSDSKWITSSNQWQKPGLAWASNCEQVALKYIWVSDTVKYI